MSEIDVYALWLDNAICESGNKTAEQYADWYLNIHFVYPNVPEKKLRTELIEFAQIIIKTL